MKLSGGVHRVVISSLVTLLMLTGILGAQETNSTDWGTKANGLQMRVYLDKTASSQSKIPKFRVEVRNVGDRDLRLNLGIVTRNGEQYPTAISLILADAHGLFQLIELKRLLPVTGEGNETTIGR